MVYAKLNFLLLSFLFCFVLSVVVRAQVSYPRTVPVGTIYTSMDKHLGVRHAVWFAKDAYNSLNSKKPSIERPFTLYEVPGSVNQLDSWGAAAVACSGLKTDGFFMLLSRGGPQSQSAYSSISQRMHIPYINWEMSTESKLSANGMQVGMRASISEPLADLILMKGWEYITYFYDGPKGQFNLQNLYRYIQQKSMAQSQSVPLIDTELIRIPVDEVRFPDFLDSFHRERFSASHKYNIIVVIDAESSYRQGLLLKALHHSTLKTRGFHYVVVGFDVVQDDIERWKHGIVNMTAFQLIDTQDWEVEALGQKFREFLLSRTVPEEESTVPNFITPEAAFAHDSILVAIEALKATLSNNSGLFSKSFRHDKVENKGLPGLYCNPKEDRHNENRPFAPFEHGKKIAEKLFSVHLTKKTFTGNIQFDKYGRRTNFSMNVIETTFSNSMEKASLTVRKWKQNTGFVTTRSTTTADLYNMNGNGNKLQNQTYIVTTVLNQPFAMAKRDKDNGEDDHEKEIELEGYCIDLIQLVAEKVGFKYKIHLVRDRQYGKAKHDGSWDGMIGELLRHEADMAVAPLTINRARERVVDFTKPFMTTGISIMIKEPDKQEFSVFSFMQPLSTQIWIYIILAYVGVSLVIFLVARFSPYEWRVEEMTSGGFTITNDFSVYNCLWFTLAAFMQQGTDILPRSVSGRIASSAWWFFAMIMVSSYTANLAAFLTLEKMKAPIENVKDLAEQTEIAYGIQGGGSTESFFRESTVPIYQKMWQYMSTQVPSVKTATYAEGIQRVRESKSSYAFMLEETANQYANTRKPCDTMKVGENLNSVGYGVATTFDSPLKNRINLAILELQERGELKKLENKWWYDRGQCEKGMTDSQSASLNLSKVAGIFYILIGGMIVAMIAAFGEFLFRQRAEAQKGQTDEEDHNNEAKKPLKDPFFSTDL